MYIVPNKVTSNLPFQKAKEKYEDSSHCLQILLK